MNNTSIASLLRPASLDRSNRPRRDWTAEAVRLIQAETQRSADTHLIRFPLPVEWHIDLYLKDESTHTTGSLKHRLARSLFLYALCNGQLDETTTVIEASSGSTAVSEAYFASLIGLPFVAVVPATTSPEKIALIRAYGGTCHLVQQGTPIYDVARDLAAECGGHYMDQFTFAERATDWRGNNNIAESIFDQMAMERRPVPEWIVAAAGTGGTSSTIGRYIRYRGYPTRLCVPDPEGSAFFAAWEAGDDGFTSAGSNIEGIGRPRVEPSFNGGVIDRMIQVPDEGSLAAMQAASAALGRRVGPSTGTNLWAAFLLVAEMRERDVAGSIVTLLCDSGDRYLDSYYDESWVRQRGWDTTEASAAISDLFGGAP